MQNYVQASSGLLNVEWNDSKLTVFTFNGGQRLYRLIIITGYQGQFRDIDRMV